MFYLTRAYLRNIGCFEELDLSFPAPTEAGAPCTVFIGDNGTGKTTLLRALAISAGTIMPDNPGFSQPYIPATLVRKGSDVGYIRCEYAPDPRMADGDDLPGPNDYLIIEHAATDRGGEGRLPWGPGVPFRHSERRNSGRGNRWLGVIARGETQSFPVVFGIGARRAIARRQVKGPNRPEDRLVQVSREAIDTLIFPHHEQQADLKQDLVNWDYLAAKGDASAGRILQVLTEQLESLLPGIRLASVGVDFEPTFETPDGKVTVEQLSDGQQSVLAICFDVIKRLWAANPDVEDPLQGRGILLLDEVDAHLHPQWQRTIIPGLRRFVPNVQILAATHSPLVAQSTGPGELVVLRRKNGTVEATVNPRDLAGWRVTGILAEDDLFALPSPYARAVEELRERADEIAAKAETGIAGQAELDEQVRILQKLEQLTSEGDLDAWRRDAGELQRKVEKQLAGIRRKLESAETVAQEG